MTLQEFMNQWTGRYADFDGSNGAQCVDIVQFYNRDVVGGPRLTGNAIDVWTTYPQAVYERIANAPTNVPVPGDIVLWGGPNAVVGTSQYGHIAICVSASVGQFLSFDQNWPENSVCHQQAHSYDAVLGWLHPRHAAPAPVPTPHPPANAADAVDTLRRHAAALTEHPSVAGTNALLAKIKTWPVYTR